MEAQDMEALQASNSALKEATARLQEVHDIFQSRLQTPRQNITIQHITNLMCLMKDECLHDSLAHFTSVFQVLSLLNTARRVQGGDDTSLDMEFSLRKLSEVLLCLETMLSRTGPKCEDDSSADKDEAEDHTEKPHVLEKTRYEGLALPVIPLVDIKRALLEYQRSSDDLLVEVFLYSRLLKIMQDMMKANESKKSRRKTVRFTSPRNPPQGSPSPQKRKNDMDMLLESVNLTVQQCRARVKRRQMKKQELIVDIEVTITEQTSERQTSCSSKGPGLAEATEKKRNRLRMPASPLRTSMVTRRRASCYVSHRIEEEG